MKKSKRVYFHYRRSDNRMSVHFNNQCIPCEDVDCRVAIQTHRQKVQPYLVMRGWANSVRIENDKAIIE